MTLNSNTDTDCCPLSVDFKRKGQTTINNIKSKSLVESSARDFVF